MSISKITIVRTIGVVLVVLNLILKQLGFNTISFDESAALAVVELLVEAGIIIAGWWYNNSYSQKALKAQEYLEDLKARE